MATKCKDCEFCFPHDEFGFVCADAYYGEDISDSLDEVKDCYSESFAAFMERCRQEEIPFFPGTKLSQIKLDGRKKIELIDQEGTVISIKASNAKKMMPDIEVERIIFQDTYQVKTIFDSKPFNGRQYLIIK